MKKILIGFLTICLVFLMVSCNAESLLKLGNTMGNMGENVYGIKPNMEAVTTAVSTVENTVTVSGDDVTINFSSDTVTKLNDEIGSLKGQTQKVEAIKAQLAEPVSSDPAIQTKVQTNLTTKKNDTVTAAKTAIASIPDNSAKNVVNSIVTNIENITIPANPTKADLVTVQVIAGLSSLVAEKATAISGSDASASAEAQTELLTEALAAIDTLTVANPSLDLMAGIDITALMDEFLDSESSGAHSISKAEGDDSEDSTEDDAKALVKIIKPALVQSLKAIGYEGTTLNQAGYDRFILQMASLRTAYEIAAYAKSPIKATSSSYGFGDYDTMEKTDQFVFNDTIQYITSVMFTSLNTFKMNGDSYTLKGLLQGFLASNAELVSGDSSAEFNDAFLDDLMDDQEASDSTTWKATIQSIVHPETGVTLEDAFIGEFTKIVNTMMVMLADDHADWYSRIKDLIDAEGSMSVYLSEALDDIIADVEF